MKNKKAVLLMFLSLTSLPAFAELRGEREPHQFASNSYVNRGPQGSLTETQKVTPPEVAQPEKVETRRVFRHAGRMGM